MDVHTPKVTSGALSASRKTYRSGARPPEIRVLMRLIDLHPTAGEPVPVYGPSGPDTDPSVQIDIERGLPRLREHWIRERGDVEA